MTTTTDTTARDRLARDIRRAVYLASVSVVSAERKMGCVLDRVGVIEPLICDLAAWIADGQNQPYRVRD